MILEVQNITKHFGGLMAVDHVSFGINEGEIFGLIGPNGAGKTTLFNMVAGLYTVNTGKIIYNNENITNFPSYKVCSKGIARTFQIVKPLERMTVIENIMVGAFIHINDVIKARQKANEIIEFLALQKLKKKLASELTLMDKKRLEIARAIATNPRLLLLDESFAGLTSGEVQNLIRIVKRINKDKRITIFIIEHVIGAVMNLSDRIMVLNEGRKIAEGNPKEIQNNKKVLEVYLGTSS